MTTDAMPRIPIWLIALILCASVLPFMLPSTPALVDLPAHISRYYVELHIDRSALLQRYFAYQWIPLPNLGVDLIVAALGRVMDLRWAVALACAAIPLTTILGALAIARQTYRGMPATCLMTAPLAFSYSLTYGFVNSCLSIGLALLVYAGWLRLYARGGKAQLVYLAACSPIVLLAHIIGFGTLGLLIAGRLAVDCWNARDRLHNVVRAIPPLVAAAWPATLLVLWRAPSTEGTLGKWFDLDKRAIWAVSVLRDDYIAWDLFGAALLYLVAALPIILRRHFRYEWGLAVPAALLWAAALLLPNLMAGSDNGASRLIPVALLVTILSVRPLRPLPSWVLPAIAIFVIVRFGVHTTTLLKWDERYREELVALQHVQPGSRVAAFFVIPCDKQWRPSRIPHLQSFATSLRDAYVQNNFVNAAGQLLSFRTDSDPPVTGLPFDMIATMPCAVTPGIDLALTFVKPNSADYVWIIDIGRATGSIPTHLKPIWYDGRSILLQVAKR